MKETLKNYLSIRNYGMNPDMKIMITARTASNNVLVLLSIVSRGFSSFSVEPKRRRNKIYINSYNY